MPNQFDYFGNTGPDQNQPQRPNRGPFGPPPPPFQPPAIPRPPLRDRLEPWMNSTTLAWILGVPLVFFLLFAGSLLFSVFLELFADTGSDAVLDVMRWFRDAGVSSKYEISNLIRSLLVLLSGLWGGGRLIRYIKRR